MDIDESLDALKTWQK